MIASTQITNTEIFEFMATLVFNLWSVISFEYKQKRQ